MLRIFCLGAFRVLRPGEQEPIGVGSKHKIWMLFKYLLINRCQAVTTERIIDCLWHSLKDPSDTAALRTTVSRLNSLLEPDRSSYGKATYIICRKESCFFNQEASCWIDAAYFEDLLRQAHQIGASDRTAGIERYRQALELYRGDFLSEDTDEEWTILTREYYRRLFMEAVHEAAGWLFELEEYEQARLILERAVRFDPYNEESQVLLIRIFLRLGEIEAAAGHYSRISTILYRELGVRPSIKLKQVYKEIQSQRTAGSEMQWLEETLTSLEKPNGPFVCEPEFFWNFLRFERRQLARSGGQSSLVILTLGSSNQAADRSGIEIIAGLEAVICQKLRRCDLLCRLGAYQLAILLLFTDTAGGRIVINQISGTFYSQAGHSSYILETRVKPVLPL